MSVYKKPETTFQIIQAMSDRQFTQGFPPRTWEVAARVILFLRSQPENIFTETELRSHLAANEPWKQTLLTDAIALLKSRDRIRYYPMNRGIQHKPETVMDTKVINFATNTDTNRSYK